MLPVNNSLPFKTTIAKPAGKIHAFINLAIAVFSKEHDVVAAPVPAMEIKNPAIIPNTNIFNVGKLPLTTPTFE